MVPVAVALTELVQQAAEAAGHVDPAVPIEPCMSTNEARHGDYQSNHAFRLGKALRTNPRAVAEAIRSHLPAHPMVATVDVAGPGFLNFHLADAWIGAAVAERCARPDLGGGRPGEGKTVVVDYSSPNIAKRMHVGHLRSTIIGDAIKRLYVHLGWTVIADNHVGDWGTQFGKLIVGWRQWRDDAAYADDAIAELQRIYKAFGERAAADPSLEDAARAETAKLQAGDPDNRALWEQFVEASTLEFDAVYHRLGVQFDVTLGESFYRDRLDAVVQELLDSGVAEVDQGAVIIRFGPDEGKGLDNSPMLIRKRDGAALYGTSDIATVQHRIATWSPDLIVYVTDVRQDLHFRQLFAACDKIGLTVPKEHVKFGMLRFADGSIAATRAAADGGEDRPVNLVDVLDTAAARAREVVDDNSRELPENERATVAEAVGQGAIKYADLSQNPKSDIVFEWDKMLAMQGNTAPYLMYAHARCRSILRKAATAGLAAGPVHLGEPEERALAVALLCTPEVIAQAADSYRPNLLCEHLFGVGQALSRFYTQCRVLGADTPEQGASRLSLVEATASTLSTGLSLLGLVPLDRM